MAFAGLLAIIFIMTHLIHEGMVTALPYPWGLVSLITVVACYAAYRTQPIYAAVYLGLGAVIQFTSWSAFSGLSYLLAALAIYLTATFVFAKRSLVAYLGIAAAGCGTQALAAALFEPSYHFLSQFILRFVLTFFLAITFGIVMDYVVRRFGRSFMTRQQL